MRLELADDLEQFIQDGHLWIEPACGDMVARLVTASERTGDPLPARLGRFLEAVRLRASIAPIDPALRSEIEAIVYPRLWKVLEALRDGLPDGEIRTRIEVMNRRLARLFVAETAGSGTGST